MLRTTAPPRFETMGDILERLGNINPKRVRMNPPPGKATEKDLIRLLDHTDRLYELVEGVLVEKVVGAPESYLAIEVAHHLRLYLGNQDRGFPMGADGAMRLMPGLVRLPDVSFVSWDKVPVRGQVPTDPIAGLAPDLAIEILSKGNTPREMERKLKEYFLADTRLVWFVDWRKRVVRVFTSPDDSVTLTETDTLDGGDVLPGFSLPVREIFARLPEQPAKKPRRGNGKTDKRKRGKNG